MQLRYDIIGIRTVSARYQHGITDDTGSGRVRSVRTCGFGPSRTRVSMWRSPREAHRSLSGSASRAWTVYHRTVWYATLIVDRALFVCAGTEGA